MELRRSEPWFGRGIAAFDRIQAGLGTDEDWAALGPFFYGRWDALAQAHFAAGESQVTTAALGTLGLPVLVLAGGVDLQWPPAALAEFVKMFPEGQYVEQPGAGHYPWLDDARQFAAAVTAFLDG